MGLLESIRGAFEPTEPPSRSVVGAYWCDDCSVRTPVHEGEEPTTDAERPPCPECGDRMRFEGTPDSGACAC